MARINIWRDEKNEPTVRLIANTKMFQNNAEFLTFCAHYGVHLKKKKKVKDKGPEINSTTFRPYLKDVYIISLQDNKDIKALYDDAECFKTFEEYANGGLTEIHKLVNKNLHKDDTGVETLSKLIQDLRNNIKSVEDDGSINLPEI